MIRIVVIAVGLLGTVTALAWPVEKPRDSKHETAVKAVLDDWHDAAAKADEARYFGHMAAESIFMGTDATERWNKEQFQKFSHPFFAKGKAWSFKATTRFVYFAEDGKTAWFDEELDTPNLGPARGTGVLLLKGDSWKIAHYNLTVPIPNDIFKDVKKLIENAPKPKKS